MQLFNNFTISHECVNRCAVVLFIFSINYVDVTGDTLEYYGDSDLSF